MQSYGVFLCYPKKLRNFAQLSFISNNYTVTDKMKIALIGYGKMGHMIEQIAISRGHSIVCKIDIDNPDDFDSPAFASADVAIEFTNPTAAYGNFLRAFRHNVKVVSGSTGWMHHHKQDVERLCREEGQTLFWASNFSVGVAIFSAVNRYLAKLMNQFPQYDVAMTETHHVHKLDAPSAPPSPWQRRSVKIWTAKRNGRRAPPPGTTGASKESRPTETTSCSSTASATTRCRASIVSAMTARLTRSPSPTLPTRARALPSERCWLRNIRSPTTDCSRRATSSNSNLQVAPDSYEKLTIS